MPSCSGRLLSTKPVISSQGIRSQGEVLHSTYFLPRRLRHTSLMAGSLGAFMAMGATLPRRLDIRKVSPSFSTKKYRESFSPTNSLPSYFRAFK